ncbi:DNA-directed RNA polymerase subunit H [Archaeoglobus profundus]|uniref:DNA-directed RNA polymerase subunit Rpo5 n=1 Tax=Archaeoglobus profundus (strain DSM 5631 / JCM 9629 / NBRC 100127 / Av18) TaxID=572546 RepID=D2RIB1_ARCPA|nr:DNA-directed RNA polymerase subunit H [Archaeoglobus profundus]ADB58036.1 RNA polymerase Rpb5 [Archaeoglobus profundus DSM 5631]
MKIRLQDHILVPKHELLSEEEKEEVLKLLGIKPEQLPKIRVDDPIAKEIGAKVGDIVRIIRESPTAGVSITYRYVVPPVVVKVEEERVEEEEEEEE